MKKIALLCLLLTSTAFAALGLTLEDFQNNDLFQGVEVTNVELVFSDELVGQDLYKVSYLVEGTCEEMNKGENCKPLPFCEYVWVELGVEGEEPFFEGTQKDCSTDLEDVLDPQIIDEL